jgi:ribonuclease-3 family protein
MTGLRLYPVKTLEEARQYSPITLAYIGDAVYELLVRDVLIHEKNLPTHTLSKLSKCYVSAPAQSHIFDRIQNFFTEEELRIFKRGRNSKVSTVPKNASVADYKKATGLEAVFGFLHLIGKSDRMKEIFFEIIKEQQA